MSLRLTHLPGTSFDTENTEILLIYAEMFFIVRFPLPPGKPQRFQFPVSVLSVECWGSGGPSPSKAVTDQAFSRIFGNCVIGWLRGYEGAAAET